MRLARLALLDLSRKKGTAAVQLGGLVTAVALAVALPLVQAVAAEAGMQTALRSLGAGADLEIGLDSVTSLAAFDSFQDGATARVRAELGPVMIDAARFARSNQLQPVSLDGQALVYQQGDPLPVASYYEDLRAHVVVTSGAWPDDGRSGNAWSVTVSNLAAEALGLKAGDVYCVGPRGASRNAPAPWCARIGAVWKPRSDQDPYWAGQLPGTDLMLGRQSLFAIGAAYLSFHTAALFVTDLAQVHAADAAAIHEHLLRLEGEYGVSSNATFSTGLGDAMQVFLSRLEVEQALVRSIELALIGVALFAIGLASIHFLEAQESLVGLWRARGGSRLRAWAVLMLQLGVLVLAALPVGAFIGAAVVAAVTHSLFGETMVLQEGILAAAAPTLGATLLAVIAVLGFLVAQATRRSLADVRRAESGPPVTAWWRRPWVDAAFAVGGVLLIAEFQLQAGANASGAPQDPLALAMPGIALALLALAALRLMPIAGALLARGPGLGTRLARWRLEREPLQHARVALLLSFALALGVFASVYLSTDRANAVDRADYEAGSDVRVTFGYGTAPSVVEAAVAAAPDTIATARVFRDLGRAGRSDLNTTVLGLDGYQMPGVAAWRTDFANRPLEQLMDSLARGDPDGQPVPGRPRVLSMWVHSTGFNATLSAELRGAGGRAVTVTFGSLAFKGWAALQAPLPALAPGDFPLRVRSLVETPATPNDAGSISLSELRAGPPAPSSPLIESFASGDGWWHEPWGRFGGVSPVAVGPDVHDGKPAVAVATDGGGDTLALHPAPSPAPLPGLISSQTAARLGIGVGDSFPLHIETNDVNVHIVGEVDYFPTLYPGQDDFLLVPGESLTERLRHLSAYAYPNEAWIRVGGSPAAAATAVQRESRGEGHVTDRESLESAALGNPLRLSLDAALVIGFIAALAMVVVGFGVHFLAVARRRVSESAIMQANGLPWPVIDRGLVTEQAVVLAYSIVAGGVLGAVLAWVILPALQTSILPDEIIPPTVVALDARTLLAAAAGLLVTAWLVGRAGARAGSRFRLNDELRALT